MKNKLILIIGFLLAFILINIFSLKSFYYNFIGERLYNKELYKDSMDYFINSSNILGIYNKANSLYKQKKYKESIKEYKSIISTKNKSLLFAVNHNVGNIFYRLGELEKNNNLKIKNWEESIKYYSDALNILYNEETKKNLEFVLNKIKQEKNNKSEQENKKDSKSNKGDKGNNKDKQDKKQDKKGNNKDKKDIKGEKDNKGLEKEGKKSEKGDSETKNKQEKYNDNKNKGKNKLSQSQEQALKKYQEALKESEQKNQSNFNKVYKENKPNDPFSNFFNDPFFNNDLLNKGSLKKDW